MTVPYIPAALNNNDDDDDDDKGLSSVYSLNQGG